VGMIKFGDELGKNMRSHVREIGGKGFQSLCTGHALARIKRAYITFEKQKLQKRRKLHKKLLMQEMHYMS
jgi:hypothetical protein